MKAPLLEPGRKTVELAELVITAFATDGAEPAYIANPHLPREDGAPWRLLQCPIASPVPVPDPHQQQ